MNKFRNISVSRWTVTGIAVFVLAISATFGVLAVSASATTPTAATASTTTLYQQQGNGGPISSTSNTVVSLSPYIPAGTYLVLGVVDVQIGSLSSITCTIGSNASGSTVRGNQGSAANLSDNGIPSEPVTVALNATAVLTKSLNRIQLSCSGSSASVNNYSVTEQAVAKLILN